MNSNVVHILEGSGTLTAAIATVGFLVRLVYRRFKRSGAQEIESFSRYAIQGIKYYIGHFVRRQLAAQLTLRQYARLHLRSSGREMLVPATYSVRLKTDQAFVPLLLRGSLQEQISYTDLLDHPGQRTMALGEPGSGKSSLFKRLFRDACWRAASSPGQSAVPIFFELRNLSKAIKPDKPISGHDLFVELVTSLKQSAVYRAARAVEDLSHGAGFFILLDGLDEVSSAQSSRVVEAIVELNTYLAETAPQSALLVSSRTQYFFSIPRRELEEIFEVFTIRPFSVGDIYKFLLKWPFNENRRENITRIFSRLRHLPSLTEMCTNPLALSMLVARDQQTGGTDLPETRSRFYNSLMDELILRRRSRREGSPTGTQHLGDTRRAILGRVCLHHLLSREENPNSIPIGRFIEAIRSCRYGGSDVVASVNELANDTGLFAWEREGETMRFMHLSLCEFLAALELVELGDEGWDHLLPLLPENDSSETKLWEVRLSEVVAFGAGLAPRSLRAKILGDLADRARRQLLLKAIVEVQAYDDALAVQAIQAECADILEYSPDEWNPEWFARLRSLITVLRDAANGKWTEFISRSVELPDSSQLLMDLIKRYRAEDELLSTLARQDADSAIGIAEETGRPGLMAHVAGAADDFSVLQGILGRYERGATRWAGALVERALIDRNIASILDSSVEGDDYDQESMSPRGAWAKSYVMRDSLYARLLDSVLNDPGLWSERMKPLLSAIKTIRPPRYWTLSNFRADIPTSLAGALIASSGAIVIITEKSFEAQATFFVILLLALVLLGAIRTLRQLIKYLLRARQSEVTIEVDGADLKITVHDDRKEPMGSQRQGLEGRVVRIGRYAVLLEILNIRRYRFIGLDDGDSTSSSINRRLRLTAYLVGVPLREIGTLLTVRSIRRDEN
jgi:hypothetical protein